MSNLTMRDEFEASVRRDWPAANFHQCDMPGSLRAGQYVDECIQHAWWGWQASRAALVIELPSLSVAEHYSGGEKVFIPETFESFVHDAIEAAGIKVAP